MFKKPSQPAPGKENVIASSRPRLGLSSLIKHAKGKVENDIESAGASLKVLSVENSRQQTPPNAASATNPTNHLQSAPKAKSLNH